MKTTIRARRNAAVLDEGRVECEGAIVHVAVGQHRFEVDVAEETRFGNVKQVGP